MLNGKMMTRLFIVWFVFLLGGCGEQEMPSPYQAIDVSWQHTHADFLLKDFNGKSVNLLDFRGKVVVLFFGYTHCPDVCPTTLADLAQVTRQLGKDASRVQVLFVTLDPERDTPELLSKYVTSFDPAFLGLYGDAASTEKAAKSFGVNYAKQNDQHGGYTVDQTDGIYMLGTRGKPLLMAPYTQPPEKLVQDIKLLLSLNQ
jgi:protein SCO1/2